MRAVPGHPFVVASIRPDGQGGQVIHCVCEHCGRQFQHSCNFPQRATLWIDKFAAQHAHGVPGIRQHFFRRYDAGLHRIHAGQL